MIAVELTESKTGALLVETELDCRGCGQVVVDFYEVHGLADGRGYVCCYECGDPKEIEVE